MKWWKAIPLCAVLAMSVPAAACGGDDDDEEPVVTQLEIELTDAGCQPSNLKAPAGRVTFIVSNPASEKVTQVQVFEGDEMLAEAKDINPTDGSSFTRDLEAGTYRLVCGTAGAEGALTIT